MLDKLLELIIYVIGTVYLAFMGIIDGETRSLGLIMFAIIVLIFARQLGFGKITVTSRGTRSFSFLGIVLTFIAMTFIVILFGLGV